MSLTNFPAGLDTIYDPSTSDTLATANHHTIHGQANDAITAIETKLGTGASNQTASTGSYLVGTGAGATQWVTTLTSPSITTSLLDANSKTWIGQTATASAVNYVDITNAATGGTPSISAAGADSNININIIPKGSGTVQDNGTSLVDFRTSFLNYIKTWGSWTAGTGLTGSMTAATVFINGVEYAIAAVSGHAFAANSDTYIDYTVGVGLVYTAVGNNTASPALAANSIRIDIAISGAATITGFNSGSTAATLPVVASTTLTFNDSLGNIIHPTSPGGLIGYRQMTANQGGITTLTDLTGMSVTVNLTGIQRVKIVGWMPQIYSTVASDRADFQIREGSTVLATAYGRANLVTDGWGGAIITSWQTTWGQHTYKLSLTRGAGTGTVTAFSDTTTAQGCISVELQ